MTLRPNSNKYVSNYSINNNQKSNNNLPPIVYYSEEPILNRRSTYYVSPQSVKSNTPGRALERNMSDWERERISHDTVTKARRYPNSSDDIFTPYYVD
ncbi:uncharacterized protein LOC126901094 isoform X2 [Daktulosphaira vitifoliae]|uniref:uncharacterized protein LOC126901094 isoform X2 n=1 Tax=Daktulosphaira vitifoliae TaxID=58002 RepID=UPI0021AAC36A|nr:uncharacterized protein LOC126901094 isoform X2 [Daktulosphaira vitifoliae]